MDRLTFLADLAWFCYIRCDVNNHPKPIYTWDDMKLAMIDFEDSAFEYVQTKNSDINLLADFGADWEDLDITGSRQVQKPQTPFKTLEDFYKWYNASTEYDEACPIIKFKGDNAWYDYDVLTDELINMEDE